MFVTMRPSVLNYNNIIVHVKMFKNSMQFKLECIYLHYNDRAVMQLVKYV